MGAEIFSNVVMQLVYFVGTVFLSGFLISLLNRWFYKLVNHNRGVCLATGLLGTPVHELSHAAMCVVFGHKIEEIKLYQIDDENGVLGYVRHSYNQRNFWAKLGNYFIGVAPMIGGSLVILLTLGWLLPDAYGAIVSSLEGFAEVEQNLSGDWFVAYFSVFTDMMDAILGEISVGFTFWAFLLIAVCIALHVNLSGADIKNALPSIPVLIILLLALNFGLGFTLPDVYEQFLWTMNYAGGYLFGVLLLSVVLSLAYVALGWVVRTVLRIFIRR